MLLLQPGRAPRRLALALLASLGCLAAFASTPPTSQTAPTVMPQVKVTTEVPLIKVGDFQLAEKRFAAAAVAHGDFVYVIGGGRGDLVTASVERFDLRTGKSDPFIRLKSGRRAHGAALADGKIYVVGGHTRLDDLKGPTRSVEIIDLATGKISEGPALPHGRANFACVAVGGKIYVIGGQLQKQRNFDRAFVAGEHGSSESMQHTIITGYTNTTLVMDLATQRWSDGVPMPVPCETTGVLVTGPSIVLAGGSDPARVHREDAAQGLDYNDQSLDQVVAFNPRDGIWRGQPPLHRGVSGHSLAFLGHYLFVFGARNAEKELIAYDLKTKGSESFTLGYKEASLSAAVVHDEKILVIGGKDASDGATDYIQIFALRRKK